MAAASAYSLWVIRHSRFHSAPRQCSVYERRQTRARLRDLCLFHQLFVGLVIKCTGVADVTSVNDEAAYLRYKKQPSASTTYASVMKIEGCSPMYGMWAKKLIHATMATASETRKTICFGAFKVGMLPPCKTYGHRTIKSDRSGYLLSRWNCDT